MPTRIVTVSWRRRWAAVGPVLLMTFALSGGPPPETVTHQKITFDLALIDDTGLIGPPGGQVAVAYEFCIPATPDHLAEVLRIDPSVQPQGRVRGRIGCSPEEQLCIGNTHQPAWRSVLQQLAALDYITRIDRHFAE